MRKALRNYILVALLVLASLFETVSGFVLWFVLPRGGGFMGGRNVSAVATFGWDRNTWLDLHNWGAVALVVIVIIHVVWHWGWIVRMTKSLGRT
jgi:hypothetical protein